MYSRHSKVVTDVENCLFALDVYTLSSNMHGFLCCLSVLESFTQFRKTKRTVQLSVMKLTVLSFCKRRPFLPDVRGTPMYQDGDDDAVRSHKKKKKESSEDGSFWDVTQPSFV